MSRPCTWRATTSRAERVRPDPRVIETLLHEAILLAREAGSEIMRVYREGFDVHQKHDKTPLTTADLAAHRCLLGGLSTLEPHFPVISEESDALPFSERASWPTYWLIDPLDGTREFIKRNDEFSVNIALVHGHHPILGIVHAPALETTYFAREGGGAWRQDGNDAPSPIRVRKLGSRRPVVAGSRSHAGTRLGRFLEAIGPHKLISMGSALKSCLVAEGVADLYVRLGPTSEWDTAAAQCVVEEAGGQITDTGMQPLRYNTKDSLLNPHFFVFGADSRNWSQYLD